MALHATLTAAADLHRIGVIASADPGAIGPGKVWIDSDDDAVRVRNSADSGWLGPFATTADITAAIAAVLDGATFTGDVVVPDEAYDATAWNGSMEAPTKNAVRDVIESLGAGYTDEQAQDAVGAMVDSTLVYVDATPLLTRAALTGDVTAAQASNATTIANDAVTDGKLRDSAALSVIGRGANSTGDPADIAAGSDGHVLRRSGTTLAFGTVATAGLADAAVTDAKRALTAWVTLTDGATITWDVAGKREAKAKVTLEGNRTLDIDNAADGSAGILIVTQDGVGSRTLTLPAGSIIVGGGGTSPSLSTDDAAVDILAFEYDGTTFYWTLGRGAA